MTSIFPYIWNVIIPTFVSEGLKPPTRSCLIYFCLILYGKSIIHEFRGMVSTSFNMSVQNPSALMMVIGDDTTLRILWILS